MPRTLLASKAAWAALRGGEDGIYNRISLNFECTWECERAIFEALDSVLGGFRTLGHGSGANVEFCDKRDQRHRGMVLCISN
jgi:hypothetical protein